MKKRLIQLQTTILSVIKKVIKFTKKMQETDYARKYFLCQCLLLNDQCKVSNIKLLTFE